MDDSLASMVLASYGGVGSAVQLARAGVTRGELERLLRSGDVVRVRKGAFVHGDLYRAGNPERRYELKVRAIVAGEPPSHQASHHAALACWGIALYDVKLARVDVCAPVTHGNVRGFLYTHPCSPGDVAMLVGSTPTVSLPLALVQTVAWSGHTAGVVALDDALHREKVTLAEVAAAVALLAERHRRRVERAIAAADPLAESVGESRTRLILDALGVPYQSQFVVLDRYGFVGRVDFRVHGCLLVEFDGLIKYAGQEGRRALADEKRRESRMAAAGYEVVRLVWADLSDPARVARLIQLALKRAVERGLVPFR